MWSAIIGGGIKLAGSMMATSSAAKQQAAALAHQRWATEQQLGLQNANLRLAYNLEQERKNENAYIREQERINREIMADEREALMASAAENQERRDAERAYAIERQIELDKEAARDREFQITQMLQNQQIMGQEREDALQALAEAKAVAAGERDEDRRQYLTGLAQRAEERDFLIDQFKATQATAQEERDFALTQRQGILNNITRMQLGLAGYQDKLQGMPDVAVIDPADLDAETARRAAEYRQDVDRAAETVASVNEANLISAGLDESSVADARRGDVAARLAGEYQAARNRAYDDALKYISGRTAAMNQGVSDVMGMRKGMLTEESGVLGAGIDDMIRVGLPVGSASDAMRFASAIPSGTYDRALLSANTYRAPIAIGSGVYDYLSRSMPSGMGDTLDIPSSIGRDAFGIGSAVMAPYALNIPGATNYMDNARLISSGLSKGADESLLNANRRLADASSGLGSAFTGVAKEIGETDFMKRLDKKMDAKLEGVWDDIFGRSTSTSSPLPLGGIAFGS